MDMCESCAYFEFDDEANCFVCTMNLDEDEMQRFLQQQTKECSYYKFFDEYDLSRKQ